MKNKSKRPKYSKNERKKYYSIWGLNNSLSLLNSKKYNILKILLLKNSNAWRDDRIQEFLSSNKNLFEIQNKEIFLSKYDEHRTQGIVIEFNGNLVVDLPDLSNITGNICLLLLDRITDPQNLGQIIRTSECAGIDGIIIPDRHSVGMTDTVIQVSQGAFVNQNIYSCGNVHQAILRLKDEGFWIVGIENNIEARLWYDIDYKGKIVILAGSEGKGIRKLLLDNCDFLATIPMKGKVNSLNVSAAVSAILFERNRQLEK
tara:strand:+ start:36 stop:812 length:777 start_codon:yes stop_codon:yes gene_type:complete